MLYLKGILLFLFIPLVLFLFLQYPFGVPTSFGIAIAIVISHRFIARPFFLRYAMQRCFWCGRTNAARERIQVKSGQAVSLEACANRCSKGARQFFTAAWRFRNVLRAGIFIPLLWYIVTMVTNAIGLWSFPNEWNRFVFQFFIAVTVVFISFAYKRQKPAIDPEFPFPIHNLSLIGAQNTLLVFRYVGFWWLVAALYSLYLGSTK